jgi:hypothetical protein
MTKAVPLDKIILKILLHALHLDKFHVIVTVLQVTAVLPHHSYPAQVKPHAQTICAHQILSHALLMILNLLL